MSSQSKPKVAPLGGSFFFISIIGLYVSLIYIVKKWPDFGFSFAVIFGIMFVASIISLTYAPAKTLIKLERWEKEHKGARLKTHSEYLKTRKKNN